MLNSSGEPVRAGEQIIDGVGYAPYSPQWYAAMERQKLNRAEITGRASGTEAGTAAVTQRTIERAPGPGSSQVPGSSQTPEALGAQDAQRTSSFRTQLSNGAAAAPAVDPLDIQRKQLENEALQIENARAQRLAHPESAQQFGASAEKLMPTAAPPPPVQYAQLSAPPPPVDYVAPAPPTTDPETIRAAQAATFARAKDQIGSTGRASVNALRNVYAERGLSGSGLEADETRQTVEGAAGKLDDVSRQQAEAELARTGAVEDRNFAAANAGAAMKFQGGITQRGQTIQSNDARYQGDIAQRGQTIQAGESAAASRRASLQALAGLRQSGAVY